jgi:hypothetical protein
VRQPTETKPPKGVRIKEETPGRLKIVERWSKGWETVQLCLAGVFFLLVFLPAISVLPFGFIWCLTLLGAGFGAVCLLFGGNDLVGYTVFEITSRTLRVRHRPIPNFPMRGQTIPAGEIAKIEGATVLKATLRDGRELILTRYLSPEARDFIAARLSAFLELAPGRDQ